MLCHVLAAFQVVQFLICIWSYSVHSRKVWKASISRQVAELQKFNSEANNSITNLRACIM